jgi:hypothetical protein|tara:strand:- start:376 stop:645 length:270 start_codon:yes stop_codon:yes gene_type:complete
MSEMQPSQEAHLKRVTERLSHLIDAKYRAGQAEHGGYLWRKKMLPNIMDEVLDLAVYVATLEEQIEEVKNLCVSGEDSKEVVEKIKRIL